MYQVCGGSEVHLECFVLLSCRAFYCCPVVLSIAVLQCFLLLSCSAFDCYPVVFAIDGKLRRSSRSSSFPSSLQLGSQLPKLQIHSQYHSFLPQLPTSYATAASAIASYRIRHSFLCSVSFKESFKADEIQGGEGFKRNIAMEYVIFLKLQSRNCVCHQSKSLCVYWILKLTSTLTLPDIAP